VDLGPAVERARRLRSNTFSGAEALADLLPLRQAALTAAFAPSSRARVATADCVIAVTVIADALRYPNG
jgi:hypothetical protein